jgi:hypothetical protein
LKLSQGIPLYNEYILINLKKKKLKLNGKHPLKSWLFMEQKINSQKKKKKINENQNESQNMSSSLKNTHKLRTFSNKCQIFTWEKNRSLWVK